ncbi:MAG: hypothetical protein QOJ89_5180, partial [bacterium]
LPASDPGYGFVGEDIPELTIGIVDGHRGTGIGRAVLDALLESAKAMGLPGISLSVETETMPLADYTNHWAPRWSDEWADPTRCCCRSTSAECQLSA